MLAAVDAAAVDIGFPDLLSAADLLSVPTWRDACLLALLEALASGTPVITTRHAGAADRVTPAAGTVLNAPDDADALARAIRAWLDRIGLGAIAGAGAHSERLSRGSSSCGSVALR